MKYVIIIFICQLIGSGIIILSVHKVEQLNIEKEGIIHAKKQDTKPERKKKHFKEIPFYEELLIKLDSPQDTIYISSRHLLDKFNFTKDHDSLISLEYGQCQIILRSCEFKAYKHNLDLVDTVKKLNGEIDKLRVENVIDNQQAYGIDGTIPKTNICQFIFKINNKLVQIEDKYYKDIFNVNLRNTEAYFDSNHKLLYVYISGSDGAGAYAAKYVIGENGFITRIIVEHCGFNFIDGVDFDCS